MYVQQLVEWRDGQIYNEVEPEASGEDLPDFMQGQEQDRIDAWIASYNNRCLACCCPAGLTFACM